MKNIKLLSLFTLCFLHSFTTQSAAMSAQALRKLAKGAGMIASGIAFNKITSPGTDFADTLHAKISDKLRITTPDFTQIKEPITTPVKNTNSTWRLDKNGLKILDETGDWIAFFEKPCDFQSEIIQDALESRRDDLPELPKTIVDTILTYDDRQTNYPDAGFYIDFTDKIFIRNNQIKDNISKFYKNGSIIREQHDGKSQLLHIIMHEYTHYMYATGHRICTAIATAIPLLAIPSFASLLLTNNRAAKAAGAAGLLCTAAAAQSPFSSHRKKEEHRADSYAMKKYVNCRGCAEKIANTFYPSLPLDQRHAKAKEWHEKSGYSADMICTDPTELAKMKPCCTLCTPQKVEPARSHALQ